MLQIDYYYGYQYYYFINNFYFIILFVKCTIKHKMTVLQSF